MITPNAGLRAADVYVTLASLQAAAGEPIDLENSRYRRPLERSAQSLLDCVGPDCDVVLLGSIASGKYVEVLLPIFGERLVFPSSFVGRGDMSRGGLMLRCVDDGLEPIVSIAGAVRQGKRPPKPVLDEAGTDTFLRGKPRKAPLHEFVLMRSAPCRR